jgi:hypothetical protein
MKKRALGCVFSVVLAFVSTSFLTKLFFDMLSNLTFSVV